MTKNTHSPRRDVYQAITDQIVEELERGVRPWRKPWSAGHMEGRVLFPLRHHGIPYRGVSVLSMKIASQIKGYRSPVWMTFKQAINFGGAVRKGERASLTVYANAITRTETDEASGEESASRIPYMKGYSAFNTEQIEGLGAELLHACGL